MCFAGIQADNLLGRSWRQAFLKPIYSSIGLKNGAYGAYKRKAWDGSG
jgi:hypothetical protein